MSTIEPSIKIVRSGEKLISIMVVMPIRVEETFDGYLRIYMPLFHTQTWAKDESDVEQAVEDTIIDYCKDAEKFGLGLEKELLEMGWDFKDDKAKEPVLEFEIKNIGNALDRLLGVSKRRFSKNMELT